MLSSRVVICYNCFMALIEIPLESIPDETSAALAGAALGAVLGSFGTYFVSWWVERRAKKHEEEKEEKNKLREYSRNISSAEISCQEMLVVLYDAQRLLRQVSDKEKKGFMITLPRPIRHTDFSSLEFRNKELMTNWITLKFKIDKLNHLIVEFNEYYTSVSKMQESLSLKGVKGTTDTLVSQRETILGLSSQVLDIVDKLIISVKDVYAYVLAHAEIGLDKSTKIKSIEQLSTFEVNEQHYKNVREGIEANFNQEKLYGSND